MLTLVKTPPRGRQAVMPRKRCKSDAGGPRPPAVNENTRTILTDRLEAATGSGLLVLDCKTYGILLLVLFPEDFGCQAPGEPTDTAPSTEERMRVYHERARRRQPVTDERDASPGRNGRSLRPRAHATGEHHYRPGGWADEAEMGDSPADAY